MKKRTLLKLNQAGMVSIIITMVMIIVMSLIVIAMSKNSIREQRQSLDRQLSDQAFYNAESGINDWRNYLTKYATTVPTEKTDCKPSTDTAAPVGEITSDGINKYTCVMYTKTPQDLAFENLGTGESKTLPLTPQNTTLTKLTISWSPHGVSSPKSSGCNINSTGVLPQSLPANCDFGGMEISLIDLSGMNRDSLRNNMFTGYFLPNTSGSAVNLDTGRGDNQGIRQTVSCSSGKCQATININVPASGLAQGNTMYIKVRSLYVSADLTVNGFDSAGTAVKFGNAQYVIDVTGKASDVLRRVKVTVPASDQVASTDFALRTSDSICKLIDVDTGTSTATLQGNGGKCPTN